MKKFVETTRWNDKWWRKGLDKDSRLLACWLWDHVDNAGFMELDMEEVCDETGLSSQLGKTSLDKVRLGYGGYSRVISKPSESHGKEWIWLRNYIKVQIGGMDLSISSGRRDSGPRLGRARILSKMEYLFPEVNIYTGYDRVTKVVEPSTVGNIPSTVGKTRYDKVTNLVVPSTLAATRSNTLLTRTEAEALTLGREGSVRGAGFQVDLEKAYGKKAKRLYDLMGKEGVNLTRLMTFEVFGKVVRDNPDTNWGKLTEYVITMDLNSGIDHPLGFIAKLCRSGDYILDAGQKDKVVGSENKKKRLEALNKHNSKYASGGYKNDTEAEKVGQAIFEKYPKDKD